MTTPGHMIEVEEEFHGNSEKIDRLHDPLVLGNLQSNTHRLMMDVKLLMDKQSVLKQANEIIEQSKVDEMAEERLIEDISVDKKKELIQSTPQLKELSAKLEGLTAQRKEMMAKHAEVLELSLIHI